MTTTPKPHLAQALASALTVLLLLSSPAWKARAVPAGHCAPARVTPIPGDPGAYRIETARATTIARRAPLASKPSAATAVAVVRVFPSIFDADGDTLGTVHDTILVTPQTVVRWIRSGPGFHTITNGRDSGDPTAASEYNIIFDDTTLEFDRTFPTLGPHDFFCYIHEPAMAGTIIVTSGVADAGDAGLVRRTLFTQPPRPNPTRGDVSFAVALPRATLTRIAVHDVAGRVVATLHDGPLPAGEHAFRWDGRATDGRRVESGHYFVQLSAGEVRLTRAVSLVR